MAADGTGLTPSQKVLVRASWDLVMSDVKTHSMVFYLNFFSANPEYQEMFRGLEGVSHDDLKTNLRMRTQGQKLFHSINLMVKSLDDVEVLVTMIQDMAEGHLRYRVVQSHYKNLKEPLMKTLKEQLGAKFDPKTEEAWSITIDTICSVCCGVVDEADKNQ